MGKANLQVGDYIQNQDTKERFRIIEYQWTFCAECTKLPFMEYCPLSKDESSLHYRYYVIENISTGRKHKVAGHYMDNAQEKDKIREVPKPKTQW